jgi:hypothetical protein
MKTIKSSSSSSKAKKRKEKNIEKKMQRKDGTYLSFHFCVWDEAFLLPSPLHVPSMLNSLPP